MIKFNINVEDVQKGYVLSSPSNMCPAVTVIKVVFPILILSYPTVTVTVPYSTLSQLHVPGGNRHQGSHQPYL